MTSEPEPAVGDRERRLCEVLGAYFADLQAGRAPDRPALLAAHPDLAPSLAEFFAEQDRFHRAVGPLRDLARDPDATTFPDESPPDRAPTAGALGHFELVRELARGGMGVVYEARQSRPSRTVALKMILAGRHANADDLRRFRLEAEAVAGLDHPNIVPIFEVGELDGVSFFSMKLLDGGSLADRLDRLAADPRAAASLVATIARAVHHAHQRGILHRDLKPSNILLDADGRPHVADFGLAKRVADDPDATSTGVLVGSPPYMAPEQAEGRRGLVTVATDVYGLGAILYACLTGRAPFRGDSVLETVSLVKTAAPAPPRQLNPLVPRDLSIICLKCLDKDPTRRYDSASSLADDLDRFLSGQPIHARPVGPLERSWRWCRRNPTVAALSLLVLSLTVAGFAGLLISNRMISRRNTAITQQRDETRQALNASDEARREAEAVSAFLIDILNRPDPKSNGHELKVVDLLKSAEARLDSDTAVPPRLKADLFDAISSSYLGLGMPERAVKSNEKALAFFEATRGPFHKDTIQVRGNLAVAYSSAGRLEEATTLSQAVVRQLSERLGYDNSEVLQFRRTLALIYFKSGKVAEAITLQEANIRVCEEKLPPDDICTLVSREYLADAYYHVGRISESIALHEGTLTSMEKKFGPDHPHTLRTRDGLAMAYHAAGRDSEAIALLEKNSELSSRRLGLDHPSIVSFRCNLIAVYLDADRFPVAEPLCREDLDRARREFGDEDARTAVAMAQLGRCLVGLERWTEAEQILRDCLAVQSKSQPDSWGTFETRSLLGASLLGLGRFAEAEPSLVAGFEGMKSRAATIDPPSKVRLAEAGERVVKLYEAWDKPEKASEWRARLKLPRTPGDLDARFPADPFARGTGKERMAR